MFVPETFPIALVMMVTSMICWGSWANTYKLTKGYRFELFYWDMVAAAWGVFVWNEFRGAPRSSKLYLAAMFILFPLAIVVISRAYLAG